MKKINRPASTPSSALNELLSAEISNQEYQTLLADKTTNRDKLGKITKKYSVSPIKDALHKDLIGMQGKQCAYCEIIPHGCSCTVEHIKPRLDYPEHAFEWNNFLIACPICNRRKNDSYDPKFLDPSNDGYVFDTHFYFYENVRYGTLTDEGFYTRECLGLNQDTRCVDGWEDGPIEERESILSDLMKEYRTNGFEAMEIYARLTRKKLGLDSYLDWLLTNDASPLKQITT